MEDSQKPDPCKRSALPIELKTYWQHIRVLPSAKQNLEFHLIAGSYAIWVDSVGYAPTFFGCKPRVFLSKLRTHWIKKLASPRDVDSQPAHHRSFRFRGEAIGRNGLELVNAGYFVTPANRWSHKINWTTTFAANYTLILLADCDWLSSNYSGTT